MSRLQHFIRRKAIEFITQGRNDSQTRTIETIPLRQLPPEDLGRILDDHAEWLNSEQKTGKKAELENTDLRDIDLHGRDLRKISFSGANLKNANLAGTKLQGACLVATNLVGANLRVANLEGALLVRCNLKGSDLSHVNLQGANITGANLDEVCLSGADLQRSQMGGTTLRRANLSDSDLTDVHGLLGIQLSGTDVSAAKLPETVAHFETLQHIEAVAEIARPIFILTLLVCLFTFATMYATSDVSLLTNAQSAILPDLNTPIPTIGFFLGAPVLLISLYVYLHLYVGNLWEDLDSLPATFPDGTPLHSKVYPWLLIRLMARHVSGRETMLWKDMSAIRAAGNKIFVFLVWWLVPLSLVLFWVRYLPSHDWYGTSLHIVLLAIAIGSGGIGLRSYRTSLEAADASEEQWITRLLWLNEDKSIALVIGVLLYGLSFGVFHGSCPDTDKSNFTQISSWIPRVFQTFQYDPYADFQGLEASTKPENWTGEITSVSGAELGEMDLRCVHMSGSFLVNAELGNTNLDGADLSKVDLRGANLNGANLNQANLTSANLKRTDLRDTYLKGSKLDAAKLENVDAERADLSRASLAAARLHAADLAEANLSESDLRAAKLLFAILRFANLNQAKLVGTDLREAILSGASLKGADLSDANLEGAKFGLGESRTRSKTSRQTILEGAILRGASLKDTDLKKAKLNGAKFGMGSEFCLQGTDIRGTNLEQVEGLTQKQLDMACADDGTRLPSGFKRPKSCPRNCTN